VRKSGQVSLETKGGGGRIAQGGPGRSVRGELCSTNVTSQRPLRGREAGVKGVGAASGVAGYKWEAEGTLKRQKTLGGGEREKEERR